MICKRCGTEFEGAFCPKCGERAEEKLTVCPVCGKERVEGENFCSKCGYAFEGQATATQKPQAKITFDKEALIGGVRKFYKFALNIGKVFFSLLLLFILASPIILHKGINTAGSGYTNAFNLYVDGRFTAVCAILMIIAFYSFIYGVYACVKFFVFRNKAESKASKFIYFAFSLAVFIVCCIGCSGAGEWFADAGAGLSFGIFVGLVGMALSVLRYLFEDKFVDSDGSQTVEVSDDVKAVEKKATKKVKLGTAVVTGVLVVAVIITSIVQGVYTNPFSSASYGFAETRADVVKQFGMPEKAKEDSSSYTYYSTEYAAAERMIDALIAAQDKELTDGFEEDADSFDEDDLESMFDGVASLDAIIEKLEEKQENDKYKKSVVTFNSDGGNDRKEDTVKSYVCEVVTPAVEGEEKEERTLTKLKIKNGYFFSYDGSAEVEYLAKYNDGSFSGGIIALNSDSYDKDKNTYTFTDSLGKYTVSTNELETISGEVYVKGSVLYIVGNTSNALANLSSDLNKIKKIEIKQGVTSVEYSGEKTLSNLEEISAPDSLVCFNISIIKDSKFYNNASNWENGKVLYIGNFLAEAKVDLSGDYTVREGTTAINENAFEDCVSLTSITIPDSVTSIGSSAFSGCSSLESITLPFVGAKAGVTSSDKYQYLLGYIFGTSSYAGGMEITQFYGSHPKYTYYYIPSALKNVTVTGGNILYGAFYNCSMLTSVTLGDGVKSIGDDVFYGCSALTIYCEVQSEPWGWDSSWNNGHPVVWNSNNNDVASDGYIYYIAENGIRYALKDGNATVARQSVSLSGDIEIPSSISYKGIAYAVTSIGSSAFRDCSSLTSITIPANVTSVGSSAFRGCTSLTEINYNAVNVADFTSSSNVFENAGKNTDGITVVFGESVERIPAYLFYVDSSFSHKVSSVTIGSNVTSIGSDAFRYCRSLTSVNFDEKSQIKSIGSSAFEGCSLLASVTFGEDSKLESIGSSVFAYCSSLTSITIPASVTSIGSYAFIGCGSLSDITVSENNANYKSADGNLYNKDMTELIQYAIGKSDTSFAIPVGVKTIGSSVFWNCSSLTSITIPDSVTSIGDAAFSGCSSLTEIIYNAVNVEDLTSGSNVFENAGENANGITVVFGESVERIPAYLFYVDNSLFTHKVSSVTIGSNVTSIGNSAFSRCSLLTSITIPESITSIGSYAFNNCSSLTIYCEAASKSSGWDGNWNYDSCPVVWNCNNNDVASDGYIYYVIENGMRYALKDGSATVARQSVSLSGDIEIPSSISYKGNVYTVTSIGEYAFYNYRSLTSITIPESVTSIGSYAFYRCSSLTSVAFGDNSQLESIGSYAFEGCSSLTSITIPASATSIGSYAFYRCSSLTSVAFGDNSQLESIGSDAFYECSSLTSITIPNGVTSIGSYAFRGCSSLTSITFGDNSQLESIGSYAFSSSSLTSITIPNNVTSIGYFAFGGCSSLTSVTFENTQGWKCSSTSLSSTYLADPATAAQYLTDTYNNYYWQRG